MRAILVVLCLSSASTLSSGAEWDSFKVTYGEYHDMPWTVQEAKEGGKWLKIDEDKDLNVQVYSQPNDPKVMLLFDNNGNIAGIRMGFVKDEVEKKAKAGGYPFEFDFDNNSIYKKGAYFGKDLWHTTVLFTSPTTLSSGGRRVLNKAKDEVAEGVFFKPKDGWIQLNRDECRIDSRFEGVNCLPGMGKHYFYNVSDQDCKHRKPIFALYDEGKLIGFGLGGFGSFDKNSISQNYFEDLPGTASKKIIPNPPKCLPEFIDKLGLTTMHVYFKKDAAEISCPEKDWRTDHC